MNRGRHTAPLGGVLSILIVLVLLLLMTSVLFGCAAAPAKPKASGNPPVFYSGVALYMNKHPNGLLVSKDRFLSCRDALDDTKSALGKLLVPGEAPEGASAVGVYIPVPIYDPSDLVPQSLF